MDTLIIAINTRFTNYVLQKRAITRTLVIFPFIFILYVRTKLNSVIGRAYRRTNVTPLKRTSWT